MREGRATGCPGDGESEIEAGSEGIEAALPIKAHRGDDNPLWAIASGMATGFAKADIQDKSQFIRITTAGLRESHVHDVIITKEAPNYRLE